MKCPENQTHRLHAVSPERFRAQATGIGQSQAMSFATGISRAQRVVAETPAGEKKFLASRGYPTGGGPR